MATSREKRKQQIVKEITLDEKVTASMDQRLLLIKGPKGESRRTIRQYGISVKLDTNKLVLSSKTGSKENKKMINSVAAHIRNMINGSTQGHIYKLKICAGHFPMNVGVKGSEFSVKNFLGEKIPRVLKIKEGAEVKVEGDIITVSSANKETAGQVSADIERLTRRSGYDTRIFQDGIYITDKGDKELK